MFVRIVTFSKYVSDPLIVQAVYEDVKQLFREDMWPLLTCLQLQRLFSAPAVYLEQRWARPLQESMKIEMSQSLMVLCVHADQPQH